MQPHLQPIETTEIYNLVCPSILLFQANENTNEIIMKKIFLSVLASASLAFSTKAQIIDLPVSADQAGVCSGLRTTVTTTGSQVGVDYYLRDSDNNVLSNPVSGTGEDLSFTTPSIYSEETFNVYGEALGQSSLIFDGHDDYVDLGTSTRSMTNQGSVACWVKTSVTGQAQYLISNYDIARNGFVLYLDANGKAKLDGRDGRTYPNSTKYGSSGASTTSVNDGAWHYLVGTMEYASATGVTWSIYVDGVLENSGVINSVEFNLQNNTTPLYVGTFNNVYFAGGIDDVTLWNIALDATTIANNYSSCMSGNEGGVTGYFNLDEGTGTALRDLSSTAIDGVMKNMYVPASWGTQGNTSCTISNSSLQMSQTVTVSPIDIQDETLSGPAATCGGSSETITSGGSMVGVEYSLMDDNGNVVDGPIAGTGSSIEFNTGAISSETTFSLKGEVVSEKNYALDFDGVNDYVNLGTDNRNIMDKVTVSCWVRTTASGSRQYLVSKYDYNSGFVLYIDENGKAKFDTKATNGSYISSGASTTSVNDGQWHYITGTTASGPTGHTFIYVDGVFESNQATNSGNLYSNAGTLTIGNFATYFSNVEIDDVSIWNRQMYPAEVQSNKDLCLTGAETMLVGYYNFNHESGTSLKDFSPMGMDGVLSNMDSATDWVESHATDCTSPFVGCELTMTQTITIDTVTSLDNTVNVSGGNITANQVGGTYQWIECSNDEPIDGATSQNFTPTVSGDYACEITMGACTETTACTYVTASVILSNNEWEDTVYSIYPNPTSSRLTITNLSFAQAIVTDLRGEVVLTASTNVIDVSSLTAGSYILKIYSEDGLVFSHFVKE